MMRPLPSPAVPSRHLPPLAREADPILAQFLRLSSDLLCIVGLDGRFRMVSPGWTNALGWQSAELVSRPWLDRVHPDDWAATAAVASRSQAWDSIVELPNRYRSKDGKYHWLQWRLTTCKDRDVIYGVAQDVTDARATRHALDEVSESLATTLNSIGDAVIATDTRGEIT